MNETRDLINEELEKVAGGKRGHAEPCFFDNSLPASCSFGIVCNDHSACTHPKKQ